MNPLWSGSPARKMVAITGRTAGTFSIAWAKGVCISFAVYGKSRLISYAIISPIRSMLRRKRKLSCWIFTSRNSARNWFRMVLPVLKSIIFIIGPFDNFGQR